MHGRRLVAALITAVTLLVIVPSVAFAGTANAGLPGASATDPLAGMTWGVYTGGIDGTYTAYKQASGANKQLLAEIAQEPLAYWFGSWDRNSQAIEDVQTYIQKTRHGNRDALVQMSIFRLDPWESAICNDPIGGAAQASYEQWIRRWARGIGKARVALILQPDLGFEECTHGARVPTELVSYAAKVFSALPYTTVYIDGGASDWMTPQVTAQLLRSAGVRNARGFALDATHYTSTIANIRFGQQVVNQLKKLGIKNMHFVINTAENGKGFTHSAYLRTGGHDYDNAPVCASSSSNNCVTLGFPPTTDVDDPAFHLGKYGAVASRLVDAYLWFGRPWLDNQNAPFDLSRALQLARTSAFSQPLVPTVT